MDSVMVLIISIKNSANILDILAEPNIKCIVMKISLLD
jgi:hypothetical protein